MAELYRVLPPDGVKIALTLFLAFLLGLEREEHKQAATDYTFGGVRTFPLIALVGYAMAVLAGDQILIVVLGLAIIAGFLLLSYWHKLQSTENPGVTSEISALTTYLVGALVAHDDFWIATTLSVTGLFLLELKTALEGLTRRIAPAEILTFTKFLLLSAVILPILPNAAFSAIQINPFTTWVVVVAVSAVSYGSYVIQRLTPNQGGTAVAAVLGGAYSSTITTVVISRRAREAPQPHRLSGSILMASGMMYVRLVALIALFNRDLAAALAGPFLLLAALALCSGWVWSRIPDAGVRVAARPFQPANPLELRAALLFAGLFVAMLAATHLAQVLLGRAGLYTLAAAMGVTDVDPFIMGMTQAGGHATPLITAATAIVIAASSNNVVKGAYAYTLADRSTGRMSLAGLLGLALVGLTPLLWLHG